MFQYSQDQNMSQGGKCFNTPHLYLAYMCVSIS